LPEDDVAYAMLDRISERTEQQGLERYEVSAYARDGHRCWHNLNYWRFGDYLGIGAGAHSKLSFAHRIVRQVRVREPRLYMERALQGQALAQEQEVGRADLAFEFMLNALRLPEGFAPQDFTDRTGLPLSLIEGALAQARSRGWLQADPAHIRPTVLGFDFLNDLQALFLPDTPAS
jgi:oxygen-independent coproporphyrinogen-3 oxidase